MESTARGFGGSPLLRRVFWIECAQSGAAVFVVLLALAFLHVLSRLLPQIAVGAIPEAAFGWLALVGAVRYAPQLLMSSLFLGIVLAVDRARRDNETLAWATLGAGEPRFTREAVWFALAARFLRRLAVARRLALGGARGRGANRKTRARRRRVVFDPRRFSSFPRQRLRLFFRSRQRPRFRRAPKRRRISSDARRSGGGSRRRRRAGFAVWRAAAIIESQKRRPPRPPR